MDLSALSDTDLAALKAGDLTRVSNEGLAHLKAQPSSTETRQGSGSDTLDAANAVGTGYMRGLTRLVGLPVDTAANVIDLGKAAIGAPYTAITGKAPPSWLEPADRANVIGSSENLLAAVHKVPGGAQMVDPVNPAFEGGYLQAAGGALNGVMRPNSLMQAGNQVGLSLAGGLGSKAVGDVSGNNALATAAGIAPLGLQSAATAGTKLLIRGGEQGRLEMAQRVADLRSAGVEHPTLGLASGNGMIGGIENLLQSTPGAMGVMRNARESALSGMQGKINAAADLASQDRGPLVAGTAIQSGIESFNNERFKPRQNALYDLLDQHIAPTTPIGVSGTEAALNRLTTTIPGAEQTSQAFINGRIRDIKQGLDVDTGAVPAAGPSTYTTPNRLQMIAGSPFSGVGVGGQPATRSLPAQTVTIPLQARRTSPLAGPGGNFPLNAPELPYDAAKRLRSSVGNELADASLAPDVPTSQWKQLYGGLSGDLRNAAQQAGPQAEQAWDRANDYTRAGMNRLQALAPFSEGKQPSPEKAFTSLEGTLKGNTSTFDAVKKSLPEDARGTVAATVIDKLGRAPAGQQDATGGKFSPETFLSNWTKLSPEGRKSLLGGFPNADQVRADIEAVARSASMMRDNSRIWANPSGTSANAAARGVLGAVTAGGAGAMAGLVNPLVPIGAGVGLGGVNVLARSLTSDKVRNAALRPNTIDPALLNSLYLSLQGSGQLQKP